ncbi:UNVERIFIED_ORG: hypothetical protein GGR78_001072 [Xanthomonas campestris]
MGRQLSETSRQTVGAAPIYVMHTSFRLQPPDARPVGPLNSRGAEHAPAGTLPAPGKRLPHRGELFVHQPGYARFTRTKSHSWASADGSFGFAVELLGDTPALCPSSNVTDAPTCNSIRADAGYGWLTRWPCLRIEFITGIAISKRCCLCACGLRLIGLRLPPAQHHCAGISTAAPAGRCRASALAAIACSCADGDAPLLPGDECSVFHAIKQAAR